MLIGGPSPSLSMNDYVAGMFAAQSGVGANPRAQTSLQSIRTEDASIRSEAMRKAAQAGPGSTTHVQYTYATGPDGQLYVTSATVTSSKRTVGSRDPLSSLSDLEGVGVQPLQSAFRAQPKSIGDFLRPRALMSPTDEAAIYGSDDFLGDTPNSDEANRRMRLQIADFGVRAQEGQHYRAAFGLGSAPEYDYELGPDGELYAVGGHVGISPGPAATPEDAAKDADTMARAALAATDVSAQDVSVARSAQSRAASLYAANYSIAEREYPIFTMAA